MAQRPVSAPAARVLKDVLVPYVFRARRRFAVPKTHWAIAIVVMLPPSLVLAQAPTEDLVVVRADNEPIWGESPQLVEDLRIGMRVQTSTSSASFLPSRSAWTGMQQTALRFQEEGRPGCRARSALRARETRTITGFS